MYQDTIVLNVGEKGEGDKTLYIFRIILAVAIMVVLIKQL